MIGTGAEIDALSPFVRLSSSSDQNWLLFRKNWRKNASFSSHILCGTEHGAVRIEGNLFFNRVWRQIKAIHYVDLTHYCLRTSLDHIDHHRFLFRTVHTQTNTHSVLYQNYGRKFHGSWIIIFSLTKLPKIHSFFALLLISAQYASHGKCPFFDIFYFVFSPSLSPFMSFFSLLSQNQKSPEPNFNVISLLFKHFVPFLSFHFEPMRNCGNFNIFISSTIAFAILLSFIRFLMW